MRVLIPELAADAGPLADALRAAGHEPVNMPLVTAERVDKAAIDLSSAQGFLVLSTAAAHALAERIGVRTFPVYAEGPIVAAALRRLGFRQVESANDPQSLARLVESQLKP